METSERLLQSGLLQGLVRRMSRLRLPIHGEVPLRKRTVPHFMVAAAGAAGIPENANQSSMETGHRSRHARVADAAHFVRHDVHRDFRQVRLDSVQLDEIGDRRHDLVDQFFMRGAFDRQAVYVVARRHPYFRITVPESPDENRCLLHGVPLPHRRPPARGSVRRV